ncbi:MAG: hypothetical protein C5B49_06500 [Bdellovibrio sp.]|nr:MAG: hypothetical protein C5B49_06500 [Bdellovibrio sp.]
MGKFRQIYWRFLVFLIAFIHSFFATAAIVNFGETAVTPNNDSDNANLVLAQQASLSQSATLQSLSFYVTAAAGKLRLGVYDASGSGGSPGKKLAETPEITPVVGWNTANVVSQVALPAGTYWLAYATNSNSLGFRNSQTGLSRYYAATYGVLPATFATSSSQGAFHFSFYGTLNTMPDTTPPSVPGNLQWTFTAPTQIGLAWTASSDNIGVAGYHIYRNGVQVGTSSTTSFTDSGLAPLTTYAYSVSAFDAAANESAQSAVLSVTTTALPIDVTPPTVNLSSPPANAAVSGSSVSLLATASDNVGVAGVQFQVDGTNIGSQILTAPYSMIWNSLTVANGPHVLSAIAWDAAGNTATASFSFIVDNSVPSGSILINNGASATNSTAVTLTLNASDSFSSVTNMRLSNNGTTFNSPVPYASTLSWILTSGAGIKTVYVQFMNAAGNWSPSFSTTITLDTTAPTQSSITATNITGNSALVGWTTNEPATSQVEYGTTTSYGNLTPINSTLVTSHKVLLSGLKAKTTYYYRVRAKDAAGNEAISGRNSFATTAVVDTTPPSVPTNLSSSNIGVSSVTLSWSASTDNVAVTGYKIYRNGTQIATTASTSYQDGGLLAQTTYTYAVNAYDAAGNNSALSNSINVLTLPPDTIPPSIPTGLTATALSPTQAQLSWSPSTDNVGVTGYFVFRNGVQVATTTSTSYNDVGLSAATTYTYAVSAGDAAGNISAQSTAVQVSTPALTPGAPTLIQHVASSTNPIGLGIPGNNFKIPLPNPIGAGDCLVLGISYPHGSSPVITDSNGNIWPTSPAAIADAGAGGFVNSIWVLPNAQSGQTLITVSFPSAVIPLNYVVSEFNNIDTVNPVSGSTSLASLRGPALSSGAISPANNDALGGNVIWNYYAISSPAQGNPTSWSAGNGFSLLDADIAWTTNQGFPHATQFMLQSSAATITPAIQSVGDSADSFNGVAVALRASPAGSTSPTGIHINKILHQTTNIPPSDWSLQIPATGNLRVLSTANGNNLTNITSITDNEGGTWYKLEAAGDEPQIWYSPNAKPNSNLSVTIHISGQSPTMTFLFWDISGAAASPLDTTAGVPSTDVSNQTTVANMPTITTTVANDLIIAVVGDGDGPILGFNSGVPAGAVFDLVTYSGEIDLDLMENADAQAHFYSSSPLTLTWNWRITANPSNSVSATAVSFKAGP